MTTPSQSEMTKFEKICEFHSSTIRSLGDIKVKLHNVNVVLNFCKAEEGSLLMNNILVLLQLSLTLPITLTCLKRTKMYFHSTAQEEYLSDLASMPMNRKFVSSLSLEQLHRPFFEVKARIISNNIDCVLITQTYCDCFIICKTAFIRRI